MRYPSCLATLLLCASPTAFVACGSSEDPAPTSPSLAVAQDPAAANASRKPSSRERAVLAAMQQFKQAILDGDTAELKRIWTADYTFINPQGALVTRAQRLANFATGSTNVQVIDNEREITVRIRDDVAIVQNLSTLHGSFSGTPTNTDIRGTFVWARRDGRWRLVTNQVTPVVN